MAYSSASDVAGYSKNILDGGSAFSATSTPTADNVTFWLSSGCAIIESRLSAQGYSVPPATNTAAYDWLGGLNALYAAGQVEMSRANVTLGPGERTRGQVFDEMFWDQLEQLCKGDLTLAGLTRSTSGKLYIGGISQADKDTVESDSDRVPPRFKRGQFNFPGTVRPDQSSASSIVS